MVVKAPHLGRLNQGSIFTCAKAERYSGCAVYAVVLTARCDLEQDKFNVLNYAPVVRLADWLTVDGYEILLARVAADHASKVESALKTIDLPLSILSSQTVTSILDSYIRSEAAPSKVKKAETKFKELSLRGKDISRWRDGYSKGNSDIYSTYESLAKNLIKELVHQRVMGFYFLPRLEPGEIDTGYVALLREVGYLPRSLARQVSQGLDKDDVALAQNPDWSAYISFAHTEFVMTLGEVQSPFIEHLLQTYSNLFGRIGLPDPDQESVEAFCAMRPADYEVKP